MKRVAFPIYIVLLMCTCKQVIADFTCPPGAEGFFAPEGQCSAEYYACANGVAYPKTCPDGEVFDPANSHCVPYEQASCRGSTTTTTTPRTTTTKPSGGTFTCPSPNGNFPIEGTCGSEYYVCIANTPYLTQCSGGYIFDPVTLLCTPPDLASCSAGEFTCPTSEGFYPVPGECTSQYYICVGGVPSLTECPAGAIFDPAILSCVLPENASCSLLV